MAQRSCLSYPSLLLTPTHQISIGGDRNQCVSEEQETELGGESVQGLGLGEEGRGQEEFLQERQ